jgi:hypothetical protein
MDDSNYDTGEDGMDPRWDDALSEVWEEAIETLYIVQPWIRDYYLSFERAP